MSNDLEKVENLEYEVIKSSEAPSILVDGVLSIIDSNDILRISFFEDISSGEVDKPSYRRVNLHLAFTDRNFKKFVKHINNILQRREAGSDPGGPELEKADAK